MKTRTLISTLASLVFCAGLILPTFAEELKPVQLPAPKLEQSKPLMQALKERQSTREYGSGNLSPQVLSNLLWAAWGINRPDSGKRTAPSAYNRQDIDVYVATAQGAYRYDAKANTLVPVAPGDIRTLTGTQSYIKGAAIDLVYVGDLAKAGNEPEVEKMFTEALETGFIGQNVYLYSASEGLATVFRLRIDQPKLAKALKLRPDQRIIGAQTVGLSKK